MTDNFDARPCTVCAALVPAANMQDHLEWHNTLRGPAPVAEDRSSTADPIVDDQGPAGGASAAL